MLGDVVRAHRRRLGWSQEDLANETGVSVRGIRKIEAHQTGTPRPATVRLLADAFGFTGVERDDFCAAALGGARDPTTGPNGAAPSAVRTPISTPPPGVGGRERELAELQSFAAATAGGMFQIVWIGGEAGVGKSTVAKALTSTLARRDWSTAWGSSPEVEGTPPAWAWADVVRGLIGDTIAGGETAEDSDLHDRLRPLLGGGTPAAARPTIAPFWVARAVVDFLRRCARSRPLLVVLDDVHRAGEETLEILRYAATELADRPVLVAATFRPTELSSALTATWAALAGPRACQLDLEGLAEPDVGRLLQQLLGDAVAPEIVRLITARTGGNPLFVGETARLIATEGVAAATELVPAGVVNVLRRRLAGLPASAQAVLRTAAVFGLDVDTEVLLSLDPDGVDTVLDGLEAAVRAGLLTELTPGSVRFSHVLVRDTIYQDLPRLRRAHLHAQVLATLEQTQPGNIAGLAHHALAAATSATARSAATRALDAAHAASAASSHQEAAALLVRALGTLELSGDRDAAQPERRLGQVVDVGDLRLDLLCALVSAQGHAGNVRGARATRGRAIELANGLGGHRRLARAYTAYDAPTLWTLREFDEFDGALVGGLEATLVATPRDDPSTRCRLLATLAMETEAHDPDRTDAASSEAVAIAGRLDDPGLLCRGLNARYRYVATLGPDRWAQLEGIGRRQLAVATAAGLDAYQTQGHHILCMAQLARNNLDQAQWHLDRAVEHATSGQLGLALGILGMFTGLRDLIAGRFDRAERTYATIMAQLAEVGTPNVEELALLVRFCLEHARAGSDIRPQVAALARQSRQVYERFGDAVAEPYARILIAAGHVDQARAVWRPHLPIRRDHYWFRWTVLRAENAVQLRDLDTAAACYRQLLPWAGHLPGLLHAHITLGPVDHTLGDLATVLGSPGIATQHYADAVRVAEQVGAAHWADRSRAALAELSCGASPAIRSAR
jgi:transcriptional regulator with XRE-family HTH domain